jgi:hypothetical protein
VAEPVNIGLNVTGDARSGVRAFNDVTAAARQTGREVDKVQAGSTRLMDRVSRAAATAGRRTAAGIGSALASTVGGGSPINGLFGSLGAAFPELAIPGAIIAGGVTGGLKLLGAAMGGPSTDDLRRLSDPTSTAEAVAGLRATAQKKADSLGSVLGFGKALLGGRTIGEAEALQVGKEQEKLFRQTAATSPQLAAAMLAQMGNPANLTKILNEELAKQTRAKQSTAYLDALTGKGATTRQPTVVFNTAILGSTQDALAVIQRAQRNNGQGTVITAPRAP